MSGNGETLSYLVDTVVDPSALAYLTETQKEKFKIAAHTLRVRAFDSDAKCYIGDNETSSKGGLEIPESSDDTDSDIDSIGQAEDTDASESEGQPSFSPETGKLIEIFESSDHSVLMAQLRLDDKSKKDAAEKLREQSKDGPTHPFSSFYIF